jgi:hypothetical protein
MVELVKGSTGYNSYIQDLADDDVAGWANAASQYSKIVDQSIHEKKELYKNRTDSNEKILSNIYGNKIDQKEQDITTKLKGTNGKLDAVELRALENLAKQDGKAGLSNSDLKSAKNMSREQLLRKYGGNSTK